MPREPRCAKYGTPRDQYLGFNDLPKPAHTNEGPVQIFIKIEQMVLNSFKTYKHIYILDKNYNRMYLKECIETYLTF